MVLIQLLTPFLVYLLAEKLELSGILAVVAAGLVQGSERDKLGLISSRMQLAGPVTFGKLLVVFYPERCLYSLRVIVTTDVIRAFKRPYQCASYDY